MSVVIGITDILAALGALQDAEDRFSCIPQGPERFELERAFSNYPVDEHGNKLIPEVALVRDEDRVLRDDTWNAWKQVPDPKLVAFPEAMSLCLGGARIRRKKWDHSVFVYRGRDGNFWIVEPGTVEPLVWWKPDQEDMNATDWEVY